MDQGWTLDGWEQSRGEGDSGPRPQAKGMLVEQYIKLEGVSRKGYLGCFVLF